MVGKVIQNYRITGFIGDGGMGSVWAGEHVLLGRKVAVKSLHGPLVRNAAIRARFKQEAATLAHLQHPCIVAMHDYIEDEDGAYLVMELVEGMPLDLYIKEVTGPIPEPQLKTLFVQILEGFSYAHGKRIVHRDIKPGNFLITPDARVKILDFGIAKIVGDGDRSMTKTGTHMGTVLYMSPEQVKGLPVDQRSDIYALGVTLFQMATGRNPYSADMTEFYVYDQIVNHPLPPASEFYPGVSAQLEAVIAKATAKVAASRFQDCDAFKEALLNGLASDAGPDAADASYASAAVVEVDQPSAMASPVPVQEPVGAPVEVAPASEAPAVTALPSREVASDSVPAEAAAAAAPAPVPAPRKRGGRWLLWLLLLGMVGAGLGLGWKYLPLGGAEARMYVVPDDLHLRQKADKDGKDLGLLPFGAEVEVLGDAGGGWKEVAYKGRQGYVNGYYLVPYEEFMVIRHGMNGGMRDWLNKSYLRIALAGYFVDEHLRADLPPTVYEQVYGHPKGDEEMWRAHAAAGMGQYNTVIRGVKLEDVKYTKDGRQDDNVVLLRSTKGNARVVAFSHEKQSDGYKSSVLGTYDLKPAERDWEVRIGAPDKLSAYEFEGKGDITLTARKDGVYPILLANPKNDNSGVLLLPDGGKKLRRVEVSKGEVLPWER